MAKLPCLNCGTPVGFLLSYETSDQGRFCYECVSKLNSSSAPKTNLEKITTEEAKRLFDEYVNISLAPPDPNSIVVPAPTPVASTAVKKAKKKVPKRRGMFATKRIAGVRFYDNSQHISIPKKSGSKTFSYADILAFELLEDGNIVVKGGLGRAALGAVTFGIPGAIVGAVTGGKKQKKYCTSLRVKITVAGKYDNAQYVDFIEKKTKMNSKRYKEAYECAQNLLSALQAACSSVDYRRVANDAVPSRQSMPEPLYVSGADEIMKYKNLLDQGILTQEEFDAKKKHILGL